MIDKFKAHLGEITSLASLLTGFGMMLAGRAPGPWPQTTAVFLVILSISVLWMQGWVQIQRQSILELLGSANSRTSSWLDRLFDPFRSRAKRSYALPLWQRRLEGSLLSVLTFGAIALVTARIPGVLYEINPPVLPAGMSCEGDNSIASLRIVIAKFNEVGAKHLLEDRIFDELLNQSKWGSGAIICSVDEVAKNRSEAIRLGEKATAAIVIWGRADESLYEVHLEIAKGKLSGVDLRPYPTAEAIAPSFQIREPVRVSFIVQYVLSQLMYVHGKTLEARDSLENAVQIAEKEGFKDDPESAKNLEEAYFLLGYLYDSDISPNPDLGKAIDYYSRAIKVDDSFYSAYINRAMAYDHNGQLELSVADYTSAAEKAKQTAPETASIAYTSLAWIFVDTDVQRAENYFAEAKLLDPLNASTEHGLASLWNWHNPKQAVDDFSTALALDPKDPHLYHHLGEAQMLNNQPDQAIETYRQAIGYATWQPGDASGMIEQLRQLDTDNPNLKGTVDSILKLLENSALP